MERSIRIARSAEEVYSAFAQLERMPQFTRSVLSVDARGDISVWAAQIEGHRYEWDVEIVQVVPKQVIGWKSVRGPKHSGRISFLSLGEDTLVFVEVSYAPSGLFDGVAFWKLGDVIGAALSDLKVTLESTPSWAIAAESDAPWERATGT
jgi:uncharacterized membrane protein